MNLNQFTIKSQEAVQQAFAIAEGHKQQAVETGHVLKGILVQGENTVSFLLGKLQVGIPRLEKVLDAIIASYPRVEGGEPYLSRNATGALQKAIELSREKGDQFVSIEHLLLAILSAKDEVAGMMKDQGLSEKALRKAIDELRKGSKVDSQTAGESFNSLGRYAMHLNEMARTGKLDPVIGRDDEIRRILQILSRRTKNNPILIGEPGVGKTELARALAEYLFNDENLMTRIDMTEYQERHSVSRLIGAPPGYIGYDEGGQLTEAVRRKPYSVVLLDEIEKAHPDVFNILLQVLDEGRLTDNKGRTANFRNTIVIMTSNVGSHIIQQNMSSMDEKNREETFEKTRTEIFSFLKNTIRPEFLNRIDEIIMFKPLTEEEILEIVKLQLENARRMLEQNGVKMHVTPGAMALMAHMGYDPQFGARPLKRIIQKLVLNEMSKNILAGKVNKDDLIEVDEKNGSIVFNNKKGQG